MIFLTSVCVTPLNFAPEVFASFVSPLSQPWEDAIGAINIRKEEVVSSLPRSFIHSIVLHALVYN